MNPLANHLYQSTVFVVAAWLLSFALRNNRAAVRYWIWLAASVKFLVPFSLLVGLGSQLPRTSVPAIAEPRLAIAIGQPFATETSWRIAGTQSPSHLGAILLVVWLGGVVCGLVFWARTLFEIRKLRRAATPLPVGLPVPVLSSSARVEPGVFGIRNPVLILPEGLADRLTSEQLDSVISHELAHVRRRDNLTAAIHLLTETIFWFHPLVWWIRRRLVEERERACDEAALARVADPRLYAEAILNVCKLYVESPVVWVSGITGADLKQRVMRILNRRFGRDLSTPRKLILSAIAGIAILCPVAAGLVWGQAAREFDAVSIKPYEPQHPPYESCNQHNDPTRLNLVGCTLRNLIHLAYDLKTYQMSPKGPAWIDTDRWVIQAHTTAPANNREMMQMLQPILTERFHLTVHWADRQVPAYLLRVAKHGLKLEAAAKTDRCGEFSLRETVLKADCFTLDDFADTLQDFVFKTQPVFNRTGVNKDARYQFSLEFNPGDEPAAGPSIFAALPDQLGLTLKTGKAPVRMFFIDRATHPEPN
jgi:bla regulator protein blaR1